MRDLYEVIERMLTELPHGEVEFRAALTMLQRKVTYTAPEIMNGRWQQGAELMGRFLPTPDKLCDWQQVLVAIWTGKQ